MYYQLLIINYFDLMNSKFNKIYKIQLKTFQKFSVKKLFAVELYEIL